MLLKFCSSRCTGSVSLPSAPDCSVTGFSACFVKQCRMHFPLCGSEVVTPALLCWKGRFGSWATPELCHM